MLPRNFRVRLILLTDNTPTTWLTKGYRAGGDRQYILYSTIVSTPGNRGGILTLLAATSLNNDCIVEFGSIDDL